MSNFTQNFIQRLRKLKLSEGRRTSMRANLSAYTDMHAVREDAQQPVRSPFSWEVFIQHRHLTYAFVALILVMGTTTAGAFAAEGSVPGDVLYPLKIHVNEPLAQTLAITPIAKADLETKLASRRVDEAITLAHQGRLTPTNSAYLSAQFNAHVDNSNKEADTLESQGQTSSSLMLRTSLEQDLASRVTALDDATSHLDASEKVETATLTNTVANKTLLIALRINKQRSFANATSTDTGAHDKAASGRTVFTNTGSLRATLILQPTTTPASGENEKGNGNSVLTPHVEDKVNVVWPSTNSTVQRNTPLEGSISSSAKASVPVTPGLHFGL